VFRDKIYRHVYANGFVDSKIATQLKVLREQLFGTQERLAEAAGMRQARISVMEDVNYSSWSISTLRRLAKAFDLYVDVEFKEFGTLERQLDEFSRSHLSRRPFNGDPVFQEVGSHHTVDETAAPIDLNLVLEATAGRCNVAATVTAGNSSAKSLPNLMPFFEPAHDGGIPLPNQPAQGAPAEYLNA
jgi:predicted XRE-type DNA-binding protein